MRAHASRLKRITMATIGAPDVARVKAWYGDWLDYVLVDEGRVPEAWGAPASAGRPYVVLGPASGEDVYVRAVEIDPVPEFKTLTTHGWAAIEITVADVDAVMTKLMGSPFRIIGLSRALCRQGHSQAHPPRQDAPGKRADE